MSNWWRFLVGALLAAVLVSVLAGARWFMLATARSAVSPCYANLKQIEGAKSSWRLDHGKTTNDIPNWADLVGKNGYLRQMPICHQGGTYTLGSVGEAPRCSIPDHVLP